MAHLFKQMYLEDITGYLVGETTPTYEAKKQIGQKQIWKVILEALSSTKTHQ